MSNRATLLHIPYAEFHGRSYPSSANRLASIRDLDLIDSESLWVSKTVRGALLTRKCYSDHPSGRFNLRFFKLGTGFIQ